MLQAPQSAAIRVDQLAKSFGETHVIPSLTAELAEGEFTVILGPSGCGKSTLLNMIAGLEPVSSGKIFIGDHEVQDEEPKNRGIAMVFQNYALYPHMSVADNIGYALKVARIPKPEREERVRKAASFVSMGEYLARRPSELSGGQRQRVAIARAIVREPKVLLFDEPLSNLDAKLRNEMRMELANLHRRIGGTSVFVTHDQVEAMTLADRILILNKGQIEQFATPDEVYHKPATAFVASFIGSPPMNLMPVSGDGGSCHLLDGTRVPQCKLNGRATLGIRPEEVEIGGDDGLKLKVSYVERLGSHTVITGVLPDKTQFRLTTSNQAQVSAGDLLPIRLQETALHWFDAESGHRIHKVGTH